MAAGLHTAEQLSNYTWKVVENDPYGQFPFLYVVMGADKCILIDTGTGVGNYREFVDQKINTKRLPYLVICTHVHFDHVGGNFRFCGANSAGCRGVCMGGGNQVFSNNVEINSLALAHSGAKVQPFTVTTWFKDGDMIYLDDSKKTRQNALEILLTPGHTPDSISIYCHADKRLFVGDNLYPFTVIHLDCLGSNVKDYIASLHKMNAFLEKVKKQDADDAKVESSASSSSSSSSSGSGESKSGPPQHPHQETIDRFLAIVGLTKEEADKQFSVDTLIEYCGGSAEEMVEFYFTHSGEMRSLCPPKPSSSSSSSGALAVKQFGAAGAIRLSCGHVEANLEPEAISQMLTMLEIIRAGALPPVSSDGGFSEYATERFSIMLPSKVVWS